MLGTRQAIWVLLENLWALIKRFFMIALVMLVFLTGVVTIVIASYVSGLPQYPDGLPGPQHVPSFYYSLLKLQQPRQ